LVQEAYRGWQALDNLKIGGGGGAAGPNMTGRDGGVGIRPCV